MKIVHIVSTPDGAPWMTALAREQKRLGHGVAAILPSLDGTTAEALSAYGVPAYATPLNILGTDRMWRKLLHLLKLIRLLRALRPDVVHSHIFAAVLSSRIASWIADVPIHFSGNVHPISLETEALRELEIGTAFCDTKTIASCSYTRELYAQYGVPASQLELVYYAVDQSAHDPAKANGARVRNELGLSEETPVIGKIAYFYPPGGHIVPPLLRGRGVKGHEVLLRAMPFVLTEFPDAKLLLVGRGWGVSGAQYEQSLKDLSRTLGIDHAVLFPGERSDVADVLAAFDVSVHSSLSENLGGSVESLLMERPMVVSDARGFADTVRHEETGLVVPKDDPRALADAIVRLLRDRTLARTLGVNGRKWMLQRFTLAHSVNDLEKILSRTSERAAAHYRFTTMLARMLTAPVRLLPVVRRTLAAVRRSAVS
jgi:glycosyltransferase involved in cell wall biosynthesis